jgi:hypothetical protein
MSLGALFRQSRDCPHTNASEAIFSGEREDVHPFRDAGIRWLSGSDLVEFG